MMNRGNRSLDVVEGAKYYQRYAFSVPDDAGKDKSLAHNGMFEHSSRVSSPLGSEMDHRTHGRVFYQHPGFTIPTFLDSPWCTSSFYPYVALRKMVRPPLRTWQIPFREKAAMQRGQAFWTRSIRSGRAAPRRRR